MQVISSNWSFVDDLLTSCPKSGGTADEHGKMLSLNFMRYFLSFEEFLVFAERKDIKCMRCIHEGVNVRIKMLLILYTIKH